jgi:hypothetical protein
VALGAVRREQNFDRAIDLLRRWGDTMAGRMSRLAPRWLGVSFGRPFGKGSGLSFARPPGLLQLLLEALDFGAEFLNEAGLPPVLVEEFLVGVDRASHGRGFTQLRAAIAIGKPSRPGNRIPLTLRGRRKTS